MAKQRILFPQDTPVTNALIAANLFVYAVQCVLWWGFDSTWAEDYLALSAPTLEYGEWWQLFTHAWLHSTQLPVHLIFNLVLLRGVAPDVEWQLGGWRFFGLYLLGILSSALGFLWWDGARGVPIVGASGAVFCVLLCFTSMNPTRRVMALFLFVIPVRMQARTLGRVLVFFELLCVAFGWLDFVAHSAHLGGALAGWSVGTWLRRRREKEYRERLLKQQNHLSEWGLDED